MIKLENVNKYYNKKKSNEIHVLNNISLELPSKGMVAIFGKSGCGKTTLLNTIGGLDKYQSGSITIDNQDLKTNPDEIRNRYIGYIFQNYNLNQNENCFDNVADALYLCGLKDPHLIEERVMIALQNVGMEKYRNRYPNTLSGGQMQRIAIARAIVKNAHIILADEPTGNLDEANTIMIMDLLKKLAQNHLVILVTHEANLVDYYCDQVIELKDGSIKDIRKNDVTNGYIAQKKTDIYLGELNNTKITMPNVVIDYYGPNLEKPTNLRIVNHQGKIYLQILDNNVSIIDETSEIKLKEGRFVNQSQEIASSNLTIQELDTPNTFSYGKLFNLSRAIKEGFFENFKKVKRFKKLLYIVMLIFAIVMVVMCAHFSTSIQEIAKIKDSYNHHTFYVYTPDQSISLKLQALLDNEETCVDDVWVSNMNEFGDTYFTFNINLFESFNGNSDYGLLTHGAILDQDLATNKKILATKSDKLSQNDIILSSKSADLLIESSSYNYISKYNDLIGLYCNNFPIDGQSLKIGAIVEEDDPAIYLSKDMLCAYIYHNILNVPIYQASRFDFDLNDNDAIYLNKDYNGPFQIGEEILLQGETLTLKEMYYNAIPYEGYLFMQNIEKLDMESYFKQQLNQQDSTLDELMDEQYYTYYDYYFEQADDYLEWLYQMGLSNFAIWAYQTKASDLAKYYYFIEEDTNYQSSYKEEYLFYYYALLYKKNNGHYPSHDQFVRDNVATILLSDIEKQFNNLKLMYNYVYDNSYANSWSKTNALLVSDDTYYSLARQVGETDSKLITRYPSFYYDEAIPNTYRQVDLNYEEVIVSPLYNGSYTLIHSSNPNRTLSYLEDITKDIDLTDLYITAILTPELVFDNLIIDRLESIIVRLISLIVLLVITSICMYFIMRSSLMSRIKEVGIYRAIGVSKRNMLFKFFIETMVLVTLSVGIGWLVMSVLLGIWNANSAIASQFLYYPFWLAIVVALLLYGICIIFGLLPIIKLLRKTPSEILTKYDI